jgi:hypothetical protein
MNDDAVTDLTRGVYRRLYSGFTKGQRINKLSLQAEAWFWRVLATVDDFGNGEADPELCRQATAGRRTTVTKSQIAKWLHEMESANLIEFYSVRGDQYLHVLKFESWQPAGKNGRRIKRFPSPDESEGIQEIPDVVSASYSDNDNEDDNKNTSTAALARQVFQFWQEHLKHPKAILDSKRERAITNRLKDGYSVDDLILAVKGCKLTPYNMGQNSEHRQYDDIELICRDATHVDRFIAKAPNANGKPPPRESAEMKALREACTKCFGTGTERTEKGARPCNHGIVQSNSSTVEGV